MEIFGDLGNNGFYSQSEIEEANKKYGHQAMTGVISANNNITSDSSIILDSGASDHMFNNREDFSNYIEHRGNVEIGEVGRSVEIIGKGDVVLTYQNKTFTLRNAFHVPSLPYCLISQTSLWNGGAQITKTKGDEFEVTVNGRRLFDGKIKNRLPFPNLERKKNTCQITLEEHRRLGHPGGHELCNSCRLGKQTRQAFSKNRDRTEIPGEEISADIVGPISPTSLGGSKYFLTVVDTASRYAWVKILKAKSQAEEELKGIVNQIENKLEKGVKRIFTDGGGEFIKQSTNKWLKEKGITHLITTRNTPQHNGTAERMNRTIMEKARTIRIDTSLPKHLWAELVASAVFLYNRNQKSNPYLRMWGIEPKLNSIKPIGSQCFYSVHHFMILGKLDPRCRKGTLVGFDEDMKSYRIWDSESGKVVRSRDVVFSGNTDGDIGEIFIDNSENSEDERREEEQTNIQTINQGGDNREEKQLIDRQYEEDQEERIEEIAIETQNTNENIRASTRTKKPADRYGNWKSYIMFQKENEKENPESTKYEAMALQTFVKENGVVPDSFKTAKQSSDWPLWRKAIFAEFDSIIENGVFEIIPKEQRDKNKSLINTRWVLNKKFDTDGTLKRYKAWCVARGFKQKKE